jgi:hypothetical protein
MRKIQKYWETLTDEDFINRCEKLNNPFLYRCQNDETVKRHNFQAWFNAKEIQGYISIARYGNEQARKYAVCALEFLLSETVLWKNTKYNVKTNPAQDFLKKIEGEEIK